MELKALKAGVNVSEEQQEIIRSEVDLLNRICNLLDSPEFKELIASHKRYMDAISTAYGVPEALWHQPKSSGLTLEMIKEASK